MKSCMHRLGGISLSAKWASLIAVFSISICADDVAEIRSAWEKANSKIYPGKYEFTEDDVTPYDAKKEEEVLAILLKQHEDSVKQGIRFAESSEAVQKRLYSELGPSSKPGKQGVQEIVCQYEVCLIDERNFLLKTIQKTTGGDHLITKLERRNDIFAVWSNASEQFLSVYDFSGLSLNEIDQKLQMEVVSMEGLKTIKDVCTDLPSGFASLGWASAKVMQEINTNIIRIDFQEGSGAQIKILCDKERNYCPIFVSSLEKNGTVSETSVSGFLQIGEAIWKPRKIVNKKYEENGEKKNEVFSSEIVFSQFEPKIEIKDSDISMAFDEVTTIADHRIGIEKTVFFDVSKQSPSDIRSHFLRHLSPEEKLDLEKQAFLPSNQPRPLSALGVVQSQSHARLSWIMGGSFCFLVVTVFIFRHRVRTGSWF